MKVLVISDIHGSGYYAEKIKEIDEREKTEKIILLGDLYYHGPRNDLSQEYNPMKVAEVLNSLKNKLLVVKGNCDAEVDEMISEFDFQDHILMNINGKNIYFTHGHKYNIEKIPYEEFDMLIYGHIHQGFIEEKEGYIFANPGSISLPKCNTEHSYLILEENKIISSEMSKNMQNMIGFRNIAVHDYKQIDEEILQEVIEKHLDNLLEFARTIINLKR